jgi:hypothetical protein
MKSPAPQLISYEVDTARRMVRLNYEGAPVFHDWAAAMQGILRAPGYEPGFGFLLDRRHARPPSPDYVKAAVDFMASRRTHLAGSRWATVVADAVSYGMARMGQALVESQVQSVGVRVFTDVDAAEAWLLSRGGSLG